MTYDAKSLTPEQRELARWAVMEATKDLWAPLVSEHCARKAFPDPEPEPPTTTHGNWRFRRLPSGQWQAQDSNGWWPWSNCSVIADDVVLGLYALLPDSQKTPPRVVERVPEAVEKAYYTASERSVRNGHTVPGLLTVFNAVGQAIAAARYRCPDPEGTP